MIRAMFLGIICLSLSGVMWGFVADAQANPDVPAGQVAIYAIFGLLFLLGGLWNMAAEFGFVEPPRAVRTGHRRRH